MAEDLLRRGGTEHQEEVSNSDAQQFQGLEGCAADAVARVLLPQPPCANAVVQLDDLPGMQERLSELTKGVTCGSIDHQAIVSFVDSARRANPAFEPDLDTTDALEGMSRVCSAFNRHICLPCRRVFVPSHLVSGHEPHFASADLVGSWQEHKAPIGENVWSSAIRLHSNALSPAFHVDGFCFWDIERLRVMSRSRFARLEPAKIPNAFDQALSSRYPSDNSDDFIQKLELPRAQRFTMHSMIPIFGCISFSIPTWMMVMLQLRHFLILNVRGSGGPGSVCGLIQ
jgi:hypothetical protein